jgi:hypothetical protein
MQASSPGSYNRIMLPLTATSHDAYWTEIDIGPKDLEFITNLLLEHEAPLTTREMARALVAYRLERRQKEQARQPQVEVESYLPEKSFQTGQVLRFAALGGARGTVTGKRAGENPDLGKFDVIQVDFGNGGARREFAAGLADHALNRGSQTPSPQEDLSTPEAVLERYSRTIEERLTARLHEAPDIVLIAGRWFPKALLADVNIGHLNLAEAVLDVAGGGPLPTHDLVKELNLPADLGPLLAEFSLDYALQEDERFDEVGPAGQVLWFLRRLEPPEVLYTPPRLQLTSYPQERTGLTDSLLALERALDDEFSPVEPPQEPVEEVTLPLLFPHWRVGTLPLSSRLRALFPTAYEAPRILFTLVDGHSGTRFPGWVVRAERYVHGLEEWFRRYDVPAGGLVCVRRGEKPGEVIVEMVDRRRRNDWIRTVSVDPAGRIGFSMLKQPVGAAYDDQMIIGLPDPKALDEAWLQGPDRRQPLDKLVAHVFRELAKLNPQSAVHAQALYSGLNVIQRLPPAPIFVELLRRRYYAHVGDLYWRFDESAWSES